METDLVPVIVLGAIAALAVWGFARAFAHYRKAAGGTASADVATRLEAFWSWWRTGGPRLATALEKKRGISMVDEVGAQFHAIDPSLSWETGPGLKGARHHLALSSEGSIERRVLAERWLSRAPPPDSTWEYYAARQAFPGAGGWSLQLPEGVSIDAAGVKVTFETDPDREVVNVTFYHPALARLDGPSRMAAAVLTLYNVLGEDGVERWIGKVDTSIEDPAEGKSLDALSAAVEALSKAATGDHWVILEGEQNGQRLVASVNLALKRIDHLLMDSHLTVIVPLRHPTPDGMPADEEFPTLYSLQDELTGTLGHDAVYVGRESGQGKRTLHFHVSAFGPSEARAQAWAKRHAERQVSIALRHDPGWEILRRLRVSA